MANERESLAVYRRVFTNDNPAVARVLNRIGFWLTLAGQYEEADRDTRDALDMRRRLVGERHPDVASSLIGLATLEVAQGKFPDALESARSAADIYTASLSASHWRTAAAQSAGGAALTGLGRYQEAEPLLTHSYAVLRKDSGAPPSFRTLAEQYTETLHRRERLANRSRAPSSANVAAVAAH